MSTSSTLQPNSPLPPNAFPPSQNSSLAYEIVLRAEEQAVKTKNLDNLRNARIVGYTILNAPDNGGIVREAIENDAPGSIHVLGEKYLHYFIKPCMSTGFFPDSCRVQTSYCTQVKKDPISSIPRPNEILTPLYSQSQSETKMRAEESCPSTDLKTAKRHALLRDQLKCMLTGMYDKEEMKKSPDLRTKGKAEGAKVLSTSCCHIFPPSIDTSKPSQAMHSTTIWQILKTVGALDPDLVASLNGDGIHQSGNVLTISIQLQDFMQSLELWFERIEGLDNTYRVCYPSTGLLDLDYLPKIVTFTTPTNFPLPRADLLAVHAAACRVAYLSGADDYLNMIEWEDEDEEQVPFTQLSEAEFASRLDTKLQRI
ncbi:hypothetical protein C8R47DRAFT_1014519, partial [Mycena vitilis]